MNIIITGAGRGIGFEAAKSIAAQGNHHIVVIGRSESALDSLAKECKKVNSETIVTALTFDLLQTDRIEQMLIPMITSKLKVVDILINNAGALVNKPFSDTTPEDIYRVFNTNYVAPSLLIKGLLPYFSANAHVLNISSMGGVQGSVKFPGLSCYSSSKAAIATLTECLAEEIKGVHFNALALGSVNTEMLREAFPGYDAPLNPTEMGDFIADFALNKGKFFNGKIIPVSSTTP